MISKLLLALVLFIGIDAQYQYGMMGGGYGYGYGPMGRLESEVIGLDRDIRFLERE